MYDNYNYPPGTDTPSAPWNQVDTPEAIVEAAEMQYIEENIGEFISEADMAPVKGSHSNDTLRRMLFDVNSKEHEIVYAAKELRERCINVYGARIRINEVAAEMDAAAREE